MTFAPQWCDDPTAPPITADCVPGCRWLVRVIDADMNRHRESWTGQTLYEIAEGLALCPLRIYRRDGAFTHPDDDLERAQTDAITVGVFERGWVKEHAGRPRLVLGVVHLWHSVTKLHRGLRRMEERGTLIALARVSLVARVLHDPTRRSVIAEVLRVVAVDLVTHPLSRDAGFIRSLTADEFTLEPQEALV